MAPDPTPPMPRGPNTGRGDRGGASGRRPESGRGPAGNGAAAYAGVGIQLGLTFVLFALLGRWLDARLGTGPWLLLVCVFVGAAAGFYSIYRRVIGGANQSRPPRPRDGAP